MIRRRIKTHCHRRGSSRWVAASRGLDFRERYECFEGSSQAHTSFDHPTRPQSQSNDLGTVRKQLLRFERAINKNQELRVKFADEPQK